MACRLAASPTSSFADGRIQPRFGAFVQDGVRGEIDGLSYDDPIIRPRECSLAIPKLNMDSNCAMRLLKRFVALGLSGDPILYFRDSD
jgi:hypothetical protein